MTAALITGALFACGLLSVADERPGTAFCFVVVGALVSLCSQ